jgi:uncharacterized membrane protein YfcA
MEIIGFLSAILIGIILGILGGGGSILSMPILVYLFHLEPTTATAYSLFIVGVSSLIGVIPKYKQGLVHLKTAILFGSPALISVFVTRTFLIPAIPDEIISISSFVVTKAILTMAIFALLMIAASFSMIRKSIDCSADINNIKITNYSSIIIQGLLLGLLTGFVGAGGGFLIIPALVFRCKLPMKTAIGTSLLIIAANSIIGFLGDLSISTEQINWKLLIIFTSLTVTGIFIGNYLTKFIDSSKLKKGFGWFILIMGIYIILKELELYKALFS